MTNLLPHLVDAHDWRFEPWLAEFRQSHVVEMAENLPIRRDIVTMIRYVQDHKVTGTKSTGNLPLKVIRDLAPQFVDPPVLDERIGQNVYPLKSEYDVWPLYFRHILAQVGGLLETPKGARWRVTPAGEAWLEADSNEQALYLLHTWWYRVNWLIAWPVGGVGDALPRAFEDVTLARLLAIPVGRRVDYEPFADMLVQRTFLTWSTPDISYREEMLRGAIRKIVAQPAADLGVAALLTQELGPPPMVPKLLAFRITAAGRVMLTALSFPAPL